MKIYELNNILACKFIYSLFSIKHLLLKYATGVLVSIDSNDEIIDLGSTNSFSLLFLGCSNNSLNNYTSWSNLLTIISWISSDE